MYYQPEIETIKRSELQKLQVERLKRSIDIALHSPFYAKILGEKGITSDSISTVEDIRKLPFTTKADLREYYPFGLVATDMKNVVRLHSSSGTTGNPTVICHSQHDLDQWANRVARCMYMVGIRNTDVFQNTSGYGMFTGGLGFQYGAERLGALTVPAAAGNSLRQVKFITDFGTTAIHAIPSYATRLAEVLFECGIDPRKDTKLKTLIIGAEPHTEEQRKRIEELLGVKAYNSFGMSEMSGPGVAFECTYQNGLHLWEDCFLMEIIDPETLEPVPDGEIGELVLTTLDRDAIFPMQIEKILLQFKELGTNYLITIETIGNNDELMIDVELGELFTDDYSQLQRLTKEITHRLKDEILLTPKVKLVDRGSLPQSDGKAVRVKDLRKK